ncbi:MAG: glycosyltransferase [Archangium sp.]|nr:glycosyltransferase [Archangium sp.]
MHALFAAHSTVGHTQALRAIGGELLRAGHRAHFALTRIPWLPSFLPTPAPLRAATEVVAGVQRDGFSLVRTPFSVRAAFAASRIANTRGYDELEWACRLFTADALASARVLLETLKRERTAVVVADYAFFGAWLAAEVAQVPFVAVYHSGLPFPVAGQPPFGSGLAPGSDPRSWVEAEQRLSRLLQLVDRALGKARASLGLTPVPAGMLGRPYATELNVLTSFEAIEPPRPDLRGPLLWAGPCLGQRAAGPTDFPWEELEGDSRPLVYVSLGTVFNDHPALYRTLIEGVHLAGARAVVAAGNSLDAARAAAGPGDVVVRFAPQVALLPKVAAFVSHGGNNSTNEALRAGTPLVLVPFGGEQIANAQRVEALGVGSWVHGERLAPASVAREVLAALHPERRAKAQALAARLPPGDGAARVAAELLRRFSA